MAAADVFVLNSGYEGFSHQILEAMTAGVPVIATAVGGNKEVIKQGENGFMVKYQDEFNLIEAIKSLWQNQGLQEEFKKEVLEFVYQKYEEKEKEFGEEEMRKLEKIVLIRTIDELWMNHIGSTRNLYF